jgi:hypothetical protein
MLLGLHKFCVHQIFERVIWMHVGSLASRIHDQMGNVRQMRFLYESQAKALRSLGHRVEEHPNQEDAPPHKKLYIIYPAEN